MGKVKSYQGTQSTRQYKAGNVHPNFIQHAIHHPGAFTAYCKRSGYGGVTGACIAKGRASNNVHVERMANFAKTLRKLPEPHH